MIRTPQPVVDIDVSSCDTHVVVAVGFEGHDPPQREAMGKGSPSHSKYRIMPLFRWAGHNILVLDCHNLPALSFIEAGQRRQIDILRLQTDLRRQLILSKLPKCFFLESTQAV